MGPWYVLVMANVSEARAQYLRKNKRKTFLAISLCVLTLGLGIGVLIRFSPLYITLRQNPGWFHQAHYEAVVAQVRSMHLEAGIETALRLDDPADPKSLRKVKPDESFRRGAGVGNVWAISKNGKLKVVIETQDLGHAGEYGFAYSDEVLSLQPFGEHWYTLDVPGKINIVQLDMKIDDHWWKVAYNLD